MTTTIMFFLFAAISGTTRSSTAANSLPLFIMNHHQSKYRRYSCHRHCYRKMLSCLSQQQRTLRRFCRLTTTLTRSSSTDEDNTSGMMITDDDTTIPILDTHEQNSNRHKNTIQKVAILGGGLAGLSTSYHLLRKTQNFKITILDTKPVGMGGASSIAGGLLHPLSPSGKIVFLGLEGLQATNQLLTVACHAATLNTNDLVTDQHLPVHDNDNTSAETILETCSTPAAVAGSLSNMVLQDSVYRIALSKEQQTLLHNLATEQSQQLADFGVTCRWISHDQMNSILHNSCLSTAHENLPPGYESSATDNRHQFGALELSGNAKVIHVPSYLRGLWNACQQLSNHTPEWQIVPDYNHNDPNRNEINSHTTELEEILSRLESDYDIVILAAGAGLFQHQLAAGTQTNLKERSLLSTENFPIQLVRGQSVEMQRVQQHSLSRAPSANVATSFLQRAPALVCGKYILPTLKPDRILVGATHEFQTVPWSLDKVLQQLRDRTEALLPSLWEQGQGNDWTVAKVDSGVRVQTHRGSRGRLPMIGHLHSNIWLFTGLSSRGLLYHGLFGDYLTELILQHHGVHSKNRTDECSRTVQNPAFMDWWKKDLASVESTDSKLVSDRNSS